jgi:hypothetical protein
MGRKIGRLCECIEDRHPVLCVLSLFVRPRRQPELTKRRGWVHFDRDVAAATTPLKS